MSETNATIDFHKGELGVRLYEAMVEHARPGGLTATEAWDVLASGCDPTLVMALMRMTNAACDYFIEAMAHGVEINKIELHGDGPPQPYRPEKRG